MLERLELKGFRSIRSTELRLGALSVLVGANGAGKSNLIAFFKLLNEMIGSRLQGYVGRTGRARSLLHHGPKVTPQMEFTLNFKDEKSEDVYYARLFHASGDTVVFAEENLNSLRTGTSSWQRLELGAGHVETALNLTHPRHKLFRFLLGQCRVYHFHDTSDTAGVRQSCYIQDRWPLRPHAENLAAFLYHLREDQAAEYQRIVATIRLIAPFFDDFSLEPIGPGNTDILLNWRERGSELLFGPHQLSDGTLRAMCLVALLLQPEDKLPRMIIVDEPELGLHPYALEVVASLFDKAACHTQVLVSTQSTTFLDYFHLENVIVADRDSHGSVFKRLDPEELESWLEDYSLGEVWRKNVIGGGPH